MFERNKSTKLKKKKFEVLYRFPNLTQWINLNTFLTYTHYHNLYFILTKDQNEPLT